MVNANDYTDLHRATLQILITHGTVAKNVMNTLFGQICEKYATNEQQQEKDIDRVLALINERISPYDQKIVKHNYSLDESEFYVFKSTSKTSISQIQNSFSESEVDFFKALLTKVTENEEFFISSLDALNLCSELSGKLNKIRAQKLIDSWIQSLYFFKHPENNRIYIGPRSLVEFKEPLQKMELDHLKTCMLCEDIAPWGTHCENCHTAVFHSNCIRKFLSRSRKCPSCKRNWTPVIN